MGPTPAVADAAGVHPSGGRAGQELLYLLRPAARGAILTAKSSASMHGLSEAKSLTREPTAALQLRSLK